MPDATDTNIVIVRTPHIDASDLQRRAAGQQVLLNAIGPHALRAVTHLDVTVQDVHRAARVLQELLEAH